MHMCTHSPPAGSLHDARSARANVPELCVIVRRPLVLAPPAPLCFAHHQSQAASRLPHPLPLQSPPPPPRERAFFLRACSFAALFACRQRLAFARRRCFALAHSALAAAGSSTRTSMGAAGSVAERSASVARSRSSWCASRLAALRSAAACTLPKLGRAAHSGSRASSSLAAVSHSDCASARLAESLPLLRLARTHGFAPFQCSTHAPHQRALPEAIPAPEPAAAASDAAAQPPARLPSGGPGCTPWAGRLYSPQHVSTSQFMPAPRDAKPYAQPRSCIGGCDCPCASSQRASCRCMLSSASKAAVAPAFRHRSK
mmetsp:Transcript_47382/g.153522  ORF Transcript_47382/g.153522 Transcript_47382/m.153522 type:complete len:315 (-) Transcript_47382:268-1212(-)